MGTVYSEARSVSELRYYTVTRETIVFEEKSVVAADENEARRIAHEDGMGWEDNFCSHVLDTEPSDYSVELEDE